MHTSLFKVRQLIIHTTAHCRVKLIDNVKIVKIGFHLELLGKWSEGHEKHLVFWLLPVGKQHYIMLKLPIYYKMKFVYTQDLVIIKYPKQFYEPTLKFYSIIIIHWDILFYMFIS